MLRARGRANRCQAPPGEPTAAKRPVHPGASFVGASSNIRGGTEIAEVRIVTREQMLDELKEILADEHTTLDEFTAAGQADALDDAFHRDLWLYYRDWIIKG